MDQINNNQINKNLQYLLTSIVVVIGIVGVLFTQQDLGKESEIYQGFPQTEIGRKCDAGDPQAYCPNPPANPQSASIGGRVYCSSPTQGIIPIPGANVAFLGGKMIPSAVSSSTGDYSVNFEISKIIDVISNNNGKLSLKITNKDNLSLSNGIKPVGPVDINISLYTKLRCTSGTGTTDSYYGDCDVVTVYKNNEIDFRSIDSQRFDFIFKDCDVITPTPTPTLTSTPTPQPVSRSLQGQVYCQDGNGPKYAISNASINFSRTVDGAAYSEILKTDSSGVFNATNTSFGDFAVDKTIYFSMYSIDNRTFVDSQNMSSPLIDVSKMNFPPTVDQSLANSNIKDRVNNDTRCFGWDNGYGNCTYTSSVLTNSYNFVFTNCQLNTTPTPPTTLTDTPTPTQVPPSATPTPILNAPWCNKLQVLSISNDSLPVSCTAITAGNSNLLADFRIILSNVPNPKDETIVPFISAFNLVSNGNSQGTLGSLSVNTNLQNISSLSQGSYLVQCRFCTLVNGEKLCGAWGESNK